jgi:DNA-binding transcriptional LysR family regulator
VLLKWLADLQAVAELGSFKAAADRRHVTAPAFGRRLKALEAWAGTRLFERDSQPVRLTLAGLRLCEQAVATTRELELLRQELAQGAHDSLVRLATGRALARGVVADALAPLMRRRDAPQVQVMTRLMAEASELLERDAVDILLSYHHPALALRLDGRRFIQARGADDRLVPVMRGQGKGLPRLLAYDPSQALGRLVDDHLAHLPGVPTLELAMRCDSVDSLREYAQRGMGLAWLPLSMVAADIRTGLLTLWGEPAWQIPFETRLFRRKRPPSVAVAQVWDALVAHSR